MNDRVRPATGTGSAAAMMDRGLRVVAAILQGFALLDVTRTVVLTGDTGAPATIALAASGAALVVALVRRDDATATAGNVVVLAAASLLLLADPTTWVAGRYLTHVLLVVMGLRLATRVAVAASGVAVAAEVLLLWRAAATLPPPAGPDAREALLWPLYGAALAVAAIAVARALRRSAAAVDRAHAEQAQAQHAADVADGMAREQQRQERLLHDTVLNTLTAVARGGLEATADQVRRRCADAAAEVRGVTDPPDPREPAPGVRLGDLLSDPLAECRNGGAAVAVPDVEVGSLPPDVVDAVVSAVGESLRNVARHARARHVTVTVDLDGDAGDSSGDALRIVVEDDGVGFDADTTPPRFGLSRAIRGSVSAAGGTTEIATAPGRGTRISLRFPPPTRRPRPRLAGDVARARSALAPALLLPILCLSWLSVLATWSAVVTPAATLAGLLAYTATVGWLLTAIPRRGIGWVEVSLTLIMCPVIVWTGVVGIGSTWGDVDPSFRNWTGEAVLSLLLTVTALGPRVTVVPAVAMQGATQVAMQGLSLAAVVRPSIVMLVAVGIFASSIRGQAQQYERAMLAAGQARVRRDVARTAVAHGARRYEPLAATVLPLLDSLAAGDADPADPTVRTAARVEERYARSLVAIDPQAGPIAGLALRLARSAHDRDLALETEVLDPGGDGIDPATLSRAEGSLAAVLDAMSPDSRDPRLTVVGEDGALVLRLVGPAPAVPVALTGVSLDRWDGEAMWEVTVPRG